MIFSGVRIQGSVISDQGSGFRIQGSGKTKTHRHPRVGGGPGRQDLSATSLDRHARQGSLAMTDVFRVDGRSQKESFPECQSPFPIFLPSFGTSLPVLPTPEHRGNGIKSRAPRRQHVLSRRDVVDFKGVEKIGVSAVKDGKVAEHVRVSSRVAGDGRASVTCPNRAVIHIAACGQRGRRKQNEKRNEKKRDAFHPLTPEC